LCGGFPLGLGLAAGLDDAECDWFLAALILRASTAPTEPIASVSIGDEWSASDLIRLRIIRYDARDRKVDFGNVTYLYACVWFAK
jgi:hypothetical protein